MLSQEAETGRSTRLTADEIKGIKRGQESKKSRGRRMVALGRSVCGGDVCVHFEEPVSGGGGGVRLWRLLSLTLSRVVRQWNTPDSESRSTEHIRIACTLIDTVCGGVSARLKAGLQSRQCDCESRSVLPRRPSGGGRRPRVSIHNPSFLFIEVCSLWMTSKVFAWGRRPMAKGSLCGGDSRRRGGRRRSDG